LKVSASYNAGRITQNVIVWFSDRFFPLRRNREDLQWETQPKIQRVAFRKLVMLHAAHKLSDFAGTGNSLEGLSGEREGQHAVRINRQYRLCFIWLDGNASEVEIVDYH